MRTVLFVHGGGGEAHRYDQEIVDRLQDELGPDIPISFPLIEGLEGLDWSKVETQLGDTLRQLPQGAIVVAHSVGASAMVKLLSHGVDPKLTQLLLLACPYSATDGEWGDSDFSFPANFARRLPRDLKMVLWHSDDDEDIPVDSAHRYAEKLPDAKVVIVHEHGHQFTGSLKFLADAIRGAMT